ncbi:acyl-coenzyme A thioesterase THEM4-like isoform X3 [Asterias rubens]|nr:acyl-coenzyme A thioesterase THEM4-like isoform X3 [Asterias rubens]XP_033634650.1 acyl-coenzyme A thioesterase THEM4-like isoform X3 [Asterias rubens]
MLITPQNDRLKETEELLSRLAATEGWQKIFDSRIDKRTAPIFTSVTTINGQVIDHALFLHKGREKVVGVCQFGKDAQGPTGWAHGGASATMHDAITGTLARRHTNEKVVTGNLNISFINPTPMRAAILMEATIQKREGRKIFLRGRLKSADGKITYTESTAIFIILNDELGKISKL